MRLHVQSRAAYLIIALVSLLGLSAAGARADHAAALAGDSFQDELMLHDSARWTRGDWWNGPPFLNAWNPDRVAYLNLNSTSAMTITLDNQPVHEQPYSSGLIQTNQYYGYGCFETRLRAAKGDGLVTSLYTLAAAPSNTPPGGTGAHNQFDLRILGNDPTKMVTLFYTNDDTYSTPHAVTVDLGFDASQGYHSYAIKWSSRGLEWYADGVRLRTAENTASDPTPSAAENTLKLLANLWATADPTVGAGSFTYPGAPVTASFDWIMYRAGEDCTPQRFKDTFDSFDTLRWSKSDGWTNGPPFNNGWQASHATVADSLLTLTLDDTPSSGKPYTSGEYRTNGFLGYGCYEARLKPAPVSGVVTSLFTFSAAPWDQPPGGNGHHNEIDIEFLGKDTTKVQANFFTNDDTYDQHHEHLIDLGFDAADDFHLYAFKWTASGIRWYIDGTEVYSVTGSAEAPTPRENEMTQKFMLNMWPVDGAADPGIIDWAGAFSYPGKPVTAQYDWVGYSQGEGCQPAANPPAGLAVSGPASGMLQRPYTFTASLPISVTRPYTAVWEATDHTPVSSTDTLSAPPFSWSTSGVKTIKLTVTNAAGSAAASVDVVIEPRRVYVPSVMRGH